MSGGIFYKYVCDICGASDEASDDDVGQLMVMRTKWIQYQVYGLVCPDCIAAKHEKAQKKRTWEDKTLLEIESSLWEELLEDRTKRGLKSIDGGLKH